jgi:hypothetical protein
MRQTVATSCAEIQTAPAPTMTAPLPDRGLKRSTT